MIPIIACSIVAAGIAIERAWTLRRQTVAPRHLLADVLVQIEAGALTPEALNQLQLSSPLGQVLAAGIQQNPFGRDPMLRSIEATGIQVVHDLERYLSTLGSVAAIAPLLGLLGTVIGMIKVFSAIQLAGIGNAPALAGGISEASDYHRRWAKRGHSGTVLPSFSGSKNRRTCDRHATRCAEPC